MGELEVRGKQRRRRRNIQAAILVAAKTAALLGVMFVAPNVPQALYKAGLLKMRGDGAVVARARKALLRRGFLKEERGHLILTQAGRRELARIEMAERPRNPKRWDGRWRALIFDIPEYRKKDREKLRTALRSLGFLRLQDSVWITPYDCEDYVALLKADFKIGKELRYLIIEEIEGDVPLREHFQLRKR